MSQQRELDVTKRDRFELLSAYLDGEVSAEERRLVTTWLSEDPSTQCLYRRLLQLRQGCEGMRQMTWQSEDSDCTATAVVNRIERFRLTCMAGLTAAAIAFIGTVSGAINPRILPLETPSTSASASAPESLELAIDQPPIAIPKSAVTVELDPAQGASGMDAVESVE